MPRRRAASLLLPPVSASIASTAARMTLASGAKSGSRPSVLWQVGPYLVLTLSEVLGHTDLLLNDGRVREVVGDDGVVRFEAV